MNILLFRRLRIIGIKGCIIVICELFLASIALAAPLWLQGSYFRFR
jgi:hypothetical protein